MAFGHAVQVDNKRTVFEKSKPRAPLGISGQWKRERGCMLSGQYGVWHIDTIDYV